MKDPLRTLTRTPMPEHPAWRKRCHQAVGQSLLERHPVVFTARVARFGRRWGWFAVDVVEDPAEQYAPAIVAEHGRTFTHRAAQRAGSRALVDCVSAYDGLWYARAGSFFSTGAVGCALCAIVTFGAAAWATFHHRDATALRDALAFVGSVAGAAACVLADEWLRSDGVR